jgi:hypothetical protein
VELVPYNLFQYSEQFDNVYWNKNNVNIVANSLVAPNGTTTADTMTSSGTTSFTYIATSSLVGTYTLSFYAKKGTSDYCWVYLNGYNAIFNLNTGAYVTSISNAPQSYNIENVGNGWYRVSITQANPALDGFSGIGVATASSFNGVVGSNIYIWGAQLVEGSTAKDYQKTETRLNIPRLDYSNGTCPSILVEPQRTNLALYSSSFDNAYWLKFNSTISTNTTTSPDGTQNADSLVSDSGLYGVLYIGAQFTAGQNVTLSIFAKANTSSTIRLGTTDAGIDYGAVFNLSNGTITSSTGVTASIQSMGNGWYRCIVNRTMAGNANIFAVEQEGNKSLYVWGAQGELGSYATSYIPTTSASVTRNADVISKTGISSLIGQTEGTFFVDIIFGQQLSPNWVFSLIGTDWITNSFYIERALNGLISVIAVKNGSGIGEATSSVTAINGQRAKIAVQYASSQFNIFVNGTKYIGTISAIPTCNDIYINQIGTLGSSNNHLQKNEFNAVALWKTALTDAQCQTLTTL